MLVKINEILKTLNVFNYFKYKLIKYKAFFKTFLMIIIKSKY